MLADNGVAAAAVPEVVQVASLRQQMDRQCKQRRYREPSPDSGPERSEFAPSQTVSHGYNASGRLDAESQPSTTSNEFDSISVSAAMPAFPGPRSVFEEAYMNNGEKYHIIDSRLHGTLPAALFSLLHKTFQNDYQETPSL